MAAQSGMSRARDIRLGLRENWHQFVLYCVQHDYAGVENLSLIPGNVGASPMQNIGAYGVEIKDVFYELEAFHKADKIVKTFALKECDFGYRESVFKNKYKDQFVITSVTYRLNKKPSFNTSYGAIHQELEHEIKGTLLHVEGIELAFHGLEGKGLLHVLLMRPLGDEDTQRLQHVRRNAPVEPALAADPLPFEIAREVGVCIGVGILQVDIDLVKKGALGPRADGGRRRSVREVNVLGGAL